MKAHIKGIVYYTNDFDEEDTRKIIDFAKDNNITCEQAIMQLYNKGEIRLYDCYTETDYETHSIESIEFNDNDQHYKKHGYFPKGRTR